MSSIPKIERIGRRGLLFTFADLDDLPTTVYLIEGPKHWFVVDTFLGPEAMKPVREAIERPRRIKPVVVCNTHYHWDHVWGNGAFLNATIVSHRLTKEAMISRARAELEEFRSYQRGEVSIILPQLLFDDKLVFAEDGVEFFHSPGHTQDSSSVYDRMDGVLAVGDNVELPLPFLYENNLGQYLETLKKYLELDAKRIIAGHHTRVTPEIIQSNIDYLWDLILGETDRHEKGEGRRTHLQNIRFLEQSRKSQ